MPVFRVLFVLLVLCLSLPLRAAAADVAALGRALKLDEIVDVMRAEGADYGGELDTELLGGSGGARWKAAVATIYNADRMRAQLDRTLEAELADEPEKLEAMVAFFGSDLGQRILTLEISARRALLDDAVEEAAQVMAADLEADRTPRFDQLTRFAEANDLIESNVMGAMNANLAFYRGLADGGAFGTAMTEADMLADIWAQEADIRQETRDWLFPYLALAYQPLPDADLDAYIRFSETPEGQAMNAALFKAFDAMFTAISRELGVAAATFMQGQDI